MTLRQVAVEPGFHGVNEDPRGFGMDPSGQARS